MARAHPTSRTHRWSWGDPVPEYEYEADHQYQADHQAPLPLEDPPLRPRMDVVSSQASGVLKTHQKGSVVIPHLGASVRVTPQKSSKKIPQREGPIRYSNPTPCSNLPIGVRTVGALVPALALKRGVIASSVSDGPVKRRGRHRQKDVTNSDMTISVVAVETRSEGQAWPCKRAVNEGCSVEVFTRLGCQRRGLQQPQYSQDAPASKPKPCARCPSDRAVLAKKGSNTVLMEVPPIIPCHPWSSVEKVKSEIVSGPQPGEKVPEGSHKIVIRLYKRKRTLATCVTRYNVIVRKCGELEVGPGVQKDCPLGRAWGARCDISCDPGYHLDGQQTTECTDDLEWSGLMPQCIASTSCPVPVTPQHGHLSCRTPQHQPVRPKGMLPDGTVCHTLCDAGYAVPPALANFTRTRCIAGTWDSDQDPVCVENNELEEEDPAPEITAEDALRFDGTECPEDFCKNGGKCIMILDDPMCSCVFGYYGPNCEEDLDPDPDESNTIT